MLKLIKAELSYIKHQIHNGILLILVLSLFALVRGFNPTNLICFILFMQFISFTYLSEVKESRGFKYMQLNLSNREIAIFRIVLPLVGFLIIYTLGIISYLIFDFPPDGFHDTVHELILFGGLGLMAFYTYLFFSDLFSLFQNKSGFIIFNIIVGSLLLIALVLTAMTVRNAYNNSISSGIILILFTYVGAAILALISYITFQHKESHLGIK